MWLLRHPKVVIADKTAVAEIKFEYLTIRGVDEIVLSCQIKVVLFFHK